MASITEEKQIWPWKYLSIQYISLKLKWISHLKANSMCQKFIVDYLILSKSGLLGDKYIFNKFSNYSLKIQPLHLSVIDGNIVHIYFFSGFGFGMMEVKIIQTSV